MEIKDIEKIQTIIKNDINHSISIGKIDRAIHLIDTYADMTQRLNNILRDDEIEGQLKIISEISYGKELNLQELNKGVVVFYDQIGTTACLGLQYLRGLKNNGYKIVYIFENCRGTNISPVLLKEVEKCCEEYHLINKENTNQKEVLKGVKIRNIIERIKPEMIMVHPSALGALGMSVMYSIEGPRKYRIVPGDHHFYIGYECFDYFIEFRPFGWGYAYWGRRIPTNKIYSLNYYPIINEHIKFEGFPFDASNKTLLCASGNPYKFNGSDVFYVIIETILKKYEEVVFVYIGEPSKRIKDFEANYPKRVFLLGYRKDFSELIKRMDIVINSLPISGGLVCQYAAYYKIPILSLYLEKKGVGTNIDDILGNPIDGEKISLTSEDALLYEADKLIKDKNYRFLRGNLANKMLQTQNSFENQLNEIVKCRKKTVREDLLRPIDRTPRIKMYVGLWNSYQPEYMMPLIMQYRFYTFVKFSFLYVDVLKKLRYVLKVLASTYPLFNHFKKKKQ